MNGNAMTSRKLPPFHSRYLLVAATVLLAQFVVVWLPDNTWTFGMAATIYFLHSFLDVFIVFLALFRVRTNRNIINAAILTTVLVAAYFGIWLSRVINPVTCSYCSLFLPEGTTYYLHWGVWTFITIVMLLAWMRPSGFSVRRVVVAWVVFLVCVHLLWAISTTLIVAAKTAGYCFETIGVLIYTIGTAPLLFRTLQSDATFDAFVNAAAYQSRMMQAAPFASHPPTGLPDANHGAHNDSGHSSSSLGSSRYQSGELAAANAVGAAATAGHDGGKSSNPNDGIASRVRPLLSTHSLRLIELEALELGKVLGSGGFGEVYRGQWQGMAVAIKKLMASSRGDALHEFVKEVDVLAKLDHKNVIRLHGVVVGRDAQYLVLEFAACGSVFDYIHRRGADGKRRELTWQLAHRIAIDCARGMAYLHSFEPPILHRDLKSQNLLLTARQRVKLCDFGLSRVKSMTKTMSRIGTVQWVAPEVLREERYSEQADVWSFGVILWELAARKVPFKGIPAIRIATNVAFKNWKLHIPATAPATMAAAMRGCWRRASLRPSFETLASELALLRDDWTPYGDGEVRPDSDDEEEEDEREPAEAAPDAEPKRPAEGMLVDLSDDADSTATTTTTTTSTTNDNTSTAVQVGDTPAMASTPIATTTATTTTNSTMDESAKRLLAMSGGSGSYSPAPVPIDDDDGDDEQTDIRKDEYDILE